jgi:hypothetical protein
MEFRGHQVCLILCYVIASAERLSTITTNSRGRQHDQSAAFGGQTTGGFRQTFRWHEEKTVCRHRFDRRIKGTISS